MLFCQGYLAEISGASPSQPSFSFIMARRCAMGKLGVGGRRGSRSPVILIAPLPQTMTNKLTVNKTKPVWCFQALFPPATPQPCVSGGYEVPQIVAHSSIGILQGKCVAPALSSSFWHSLSTRPGPGTGCCRSLSFPQQNSAQNPLAPSHPHPHEQRMSMSVGRI